MSKTVDERVVEMRFDNKQFEAGVRTSMSTLEKLKSSLKLKDAAKSFESIDKAANNVSFAGISSGLEALQKRFSTTGIIGMRVIENLTDSVMHLANKASSFVTSSITQGGIKRAMNIENAHFQLQGLLKDEELVQAVMKDAMDSVDGTAYAYDSAAKAASQFAASGMRAGAEMQSSLRAITGVAAMTNSEYEDISRIFTTVAGNGRLMGDQLLQLSGRGLNAAATLADYLTKVGNGAKVTEADVREMVSKGKISFDTFAAAMDNAFGEHAKKANETFTGSMSNVKAALGRIGAEFVSPLIEQNGPLVQFFNALRERINDVKANIGPLANAFTGAATKMLGGVTDLLKGLGKTSKWDSFIEKVNEAGVSTEKFEEKLKETAKSEGIAIDDVISKEGSLADAFKNGSLSTGLISDTLKNLVGDMSEAGKSTEDMTAKLQYFQDVVDRVWRGDFMNGAERVTALTEAGYDYAEVQALVNKTVDGHRLRIEELSDAQLKNEGYTEEQIRLVRELAEEAEKTGTPLNELIESLNKPTTGSLLLGTVKNLLQGIKKSLNAVRDAWKEVFSSHKSTGLYKIVEGIHSLSTHLAISDETADKLKKTFKGVFAIFDTVGTIVGGVVKTAFQAVSDICGKLNIDILGITASLGDMMVKFRDWVSKNDVVATGVKKVASAVKTSIATVKKWISAFLELPKVQGIIEKLKAGVTKFAEVAKDTIDGLINGLKDGTLPIVEIITDIGNKLIEAIKGVLGINSPSTVMFDIGKNVIEGLVNGLKDGVSTVLGVLKDVALGIIEVVKEIAGKAAETFNGVDWTSVAVIATIGGIVVVLNKLTEALTILSEPFKGINSVLKGAGNVLNSVSKAIDNKFGKADKTTALLNFAKAIAILSGSIYILAQLDTGKLWSCIGAIGALAGIMVVLSVAVDKFGPEKAIEFDKFAVAVLGISASLLIMSFALSRIASIEPERMQQACEGLTVVVLGLATILTVYAGIAKFGGTGDIDKAGATLLKLSGSLLIMSFVLKILGTMDSEGLAQGLNVMGYLGLFISGLIITTSMFEKKADNVGKVLLEMSVSMLLLVSTIKRISSLEPGDIAKGIVTMAAFGLIFAELIAITKLAGKNADKIKNTLTSMSVSILILTVVIKMISKLEPEEIAYGLIAISTFGLVIGELLLISRLAGKDAPKIAATIIAMSTAIAILAGVAVLMSMIDTSALAKGVVAVGVLGLVMAAMIAASRGASDCKGNLIVMTVAIGIMAAAVAALSFIDGDKLAGATAALSTVMAVFALMTKAAGSLSGSSLQSVASLMVLAGVVLVLGGILSELASLPVAGALAASASLSTLLLSMSASMRIISTAGTITPMALATMGVMTAVVGLLGGILWLLQDLPVDSTIAIAGSLSVLLLSLSASCLILSEVGMLGSAAFVGIGALVTLIASMGTLMGAIGALTTYFPQLEEFLDKGIGILEDIGYGIGAFVGNIVGGALAGLTSGLPEIADNLSAFMEGMEPFFESVKGIDEGAMNGVNALCEALLKLIGANFLDKLTEFFFGEDTSLADFGEQLKTFGKAMADFSKSVSGKIDEAGVTAAANAGKMMSELQSGLSGTGGFIQEITGEKNLSDFGEQLVTFGKSIASFSESVSGKIDEASVTAAANAGKLMSEVKESLNNSGGLIQTLTGEKNLGDFGAQLVLFGQAIVSFSKKVAGNIDEEAVTAAYNAGMIMSELKESLPEDGGWFGKIFGGDQDMSAFGEELVDLGQALVDFSNKVEGAINNESIDWAVSAVTDIIDLSKKISNAETADMTTFTAQATSFGKALKAYSDALKGVDAESVSNSAAGAKKIAEFIKGLVGLDISGVGNFVSALSVLGQADVEGFVSAFSDSTERMSSVGMDLMTSIASGVSSKTSSLVEAASSIISEMITGIEDKYSSFTSAGKKLIEHLTSGIESNNSSVMTAVTTLVGDAADSIESYYDTFYNSGAYLVEGFANGISANTYLATAKASAMASAATTAARKVLDERSPSKVFYGIGAFAGQGFINAFSDYTSKSYRAGSELAGSAEKGLTKAVSRIADVMSGDMDAQPTIRPVLDLSEIKAGAGSIQRIIGNDQTLGITASVNAINARMERRNQNGTAGEIVSAINKLRKDLGNVGGTSYNINGITYDDGSNIAEAVSDIIRAANIERRR